MRARFYVAIGAIVAAGIAATVLAINRTPQPLSPPASPLDASVALTCTGQARHCTSPGQVRWSVALPPAALDSATDTVGMPVGSVQEQGDLSFLGSGVASTPEPVASLAGGLLVYQQGGLVQGIQAATGQARWQVHLPVDASPQPISGGWWNTPVAPAVAGSQIVVTTMDAAGEVEMAWLIDAATGAVQAHLRLNYNNAVVLAPTRGGLAVETHNTVIVDLDWATGKVRWQVRLPKSADGDLPIVIGATAYFQVGFTIQRVDLRTGRALPAVDLPSDMRNKISPPVLSADPGSGELIANGSNAIAVIDPATGRVLWSVTGNFKSGTGLQASPDSAPPAGVYLTATGGSPRRYRMVTVNLASGRPVQTVILSRRTASAYLTKQLTVFQNMSALRYQTSLNLSGLSYHSPIVTDSGIVPSGSAAAEWARLTGIDPRTGAPSWTGPWTSSNMEVLGWTTAGPPEIIVESCAPDGMHLRQPLGTSPEGPDGTCSAVRLFAINA